MDLRRGNCLIAVLMFSLAVPSESKLSSVPPKLIITPSGFPLLKSKIASQENLKKYVCPNIFMYRILLTGFIQKYLSIFLRSDFRGD